MTSETQSTERTELARRRAEKVARLRATMAKKRAAGEPAGRLPLGFTASRADGAPSILEDPFALGLLAEAQEMRVRGCSVRTIRRYLTEKGLTGKSGKPLSVSGLWKVLKTL